MADVLVSQPTAPKELSNETMRVLLALTKLEARLWRHLAIGTYDPTLEADVALANALTEWWNNYHLQHTKGDPQ